MTNDVNQLTLHDWWEQISFQGKELFTMKDNGELLLQALDSTKERTVASLNTSNADTVLKALRDKFTELAAKVKELENEWVSAADKLKLAGKVERLKDYLQHANAVGDFSRLYQLVNDWANTVHTLSEDNYKLKLKLVQQAEELVNSDNIKETTQAFRDLTEQWKQTGYLDKTRNDALWNRLETARNKFFEHKRHHQEEHEKEMLQNLDLKLELVEKAERLAASESWKETTESFKQLMDEWKTIGRTMAEKNEELWNRFITAKNVFYDRKKIHFESIQKEQEANYAIKLTLVEKAEALKESTDWGTASQAYADLMEEWKNVGRVPLEKADELWSRLNAAKDHFFNAKRRHFEALRMSHEDNYAQKMALLNRAEKLKNSTHWKDASDEMNELMTEWKKIGPLSREHSNTMWEQFIAARKYFFNRKDENREQRKRHAEKQMQTRVEQTRNFLTKLEEELKDEEDKIADFTNGLQNITPGHKAEELRQHLEKLIEQSKERVKRRAEKIEEVKQQLEELEAKATAKDNAASEAEHEDNSEES
ncbi:MAG: DUF349 domain-containing protein [Flavipsychrobacter sp.]